MYHFAGFFFQRLIFENFTCNFVGKKRGGGIVLKNFIFCEKKYNLTKFFNNFQVNSFAAEQV